MFGFTRSYWQELLPHLPLWHALTLPQRQAVLSLPHTYQAPLHALRNLAPHLDAALFETDAAGRKRPSVALRRLTAFNLRLATWSLPDGIEIEFYVRSTTTLAQRNAFTGLRPGSDPALATFAYADRMAAGAFSRALAESKKPQDFIRAMGGWVPDGQEFGTVRYLALKAWLSRATEKGSSIRMLDATAFEDAGGACDAVDLLHLAVGFGLCLPVRTLDTLLPAFVVFAPAAAADQKPANVKYRPASSAARETFSRPFLLDDIDAWLRALKLSPAPVLSDGWNVPLAHQRKVAKGLAPLPGFLPQKVFEAEDRSAAALWMVFGLKLAAAHGDARKEWRFGLGPRGEAWLGRSREEKMADILQIVPMGGRAERNWQETFDYLGDFEANPMPYRAATNTVFAWLHEAFAGLRAPSDWQTFRDSAAEKANPFLFEADQHAELAGRWGAWDADAQETYAALLHGYAGRLAGLGALAFGDLGKGNLAVSLSPVGEWLFGLRDAWSLPQAPKGVAVVSADFTVTLLERTPEAALDLSAFADSEGNVFRITKKSVQAAAHLGRTAVSMLAVLEGLSKHALPPNVAHEIREWAEARKTVRLEETLLIEGDDPVVLAEIRATFPKEFAPVGTVALKYLGKGKREAVLRRLAKKGFFCG